MASSFGQDLALLAKVLLLPRVAPEANGVDHTSLLFISKERVEGHTWFFINDFIENWLHFSIQMRVIFFKLFLFPSPASLTFPKRPNTASLT